MLKKDINPLRFLTSRGVTPREFNSYGSRRGNDAVMARGTFANIRLVNKLVGGGKAGPKTVHLPSGETLDVFDAAEKYRETGTPLIILAGKDYGSGTVNTYGIYCRYFYGYYTRYCNLAIVRCARLLLEEQFALTALKDYS